MDHGRVEQIGTPNEVYEHPATPFVYSFLGAVNRFQGRTDGELLRVGTQTLEHGAQGLAQGAQVLGFARPHELEIVTALSLSEAPAHGIDAQVVRVLSFGASSRVELTGPQGQHYEVELGRERAAALALESGQHVRLVPSRLSVFADPQALAEPEAA
jgi:sulfate transport system ATP-binding protein